MDKIRHILFFLLLIFASSCSDDLGIKPDKIFDKTTGNAITLTLSVKDNDQYGQASLRSSESGAVLRGVGIEDGDKYKDIYDPKILNENKIDLINIFVFDAGGNVIVSYIDSEVERLNTTNTTDGTYRIRLLVPHTHIAAIANKNVKIVAIVNPEKDITGINTIAELKAEFEEYADLNTTEVAREHFLMDGTRDANSITWEPDKLEYELSDPIELRRALAKIRLRIAGIAITDFQNAGETEYEIVTIGEGEDEKEDISVKLVKYKNATSLIAGAPYSGAQVVAQTDYRYMPIRNFSDKKSPNSDGNYRAAFPFYAAETEWKAKSPDETHMIVRIKLRPIEHNDGDEGTYYYYRIPINYRKPMDGVIEDRLHKVERNYLYDVVTTIQQLGSLDEGNPVNVESYIAIQPWPSQPDKVDGTIMQAHYLVVKETHPIMAHVDTYAIDYISDLPVNITIDKAYYEYYDKRGDYYKVVFSPTDNTYTFYKDPEETQPLTKQEITDLGLILPDNPIGPFDDTEVPWTKDKYIQDGVITVNHKVPNNFVPFKIEFTVKQEDTDPEAETLSEKVFVTQYPPIFVTGQKSPGFRGGTSEIITGAQSDVVVDFRFHSTYGAPSKYQNSTVYEAQKNNIFNRITTKVPTDDYLVGNPVDGDGYTKKDALSNKMVSPEFIIASQYGMSQDIPQSRNDTTTSPSRRTASTFFVGYGPYSTDLYPVSMPYREYTPTETWFTTEGFYGYNLSFYKSYANAEDRCYNYFEGEYGMDGTYTEHYVDSNGNWTSRQVTKTFKYQGRWRVPTAAEVRKIAAIQDDEKSVTKSLMFGTRYWTAQTGKAYKFSPSPGELVDATAAPVRCVFDTYKHDDK